MTNTELIAPGIVKFSNCFDVTDDELTQLVSQVEMSFQDNYQFVYDEDGNLLHGINKSYHIVPAEHIFALPVRIYDNLNVELVTRLEESIQKHLVQYVLMFPEVMRSIWWRTVGHVSAYPAGTSLDTHSDNDVNYRPGSTPIDQAAVQHSLSCTAVLNDDFDGGNLFFEYYDVDVDVKKGDILFFPSNYVGTHCVKLIKSGIRFSYVSWYGQGSAREEHNINPRHLSEVGYQQGKIWMDHLYDECEKIIASGDWPAKRVFLRAYDH